MDCFRILPEDIAVDILSRLPIESVLECKLVAKAWRNHVRHPSFSRMQLQAHSSSAAVDSGELGFIALSYDVDTGNESFWYFEYNHESTQPIQRIRMINLDSPIKNSLFVGSCNGLICLARGPLVCICNPITRETIMLPQIVKRYWRIGFGYVSSTDEYKVLGICNAETNFVEAYIYSLGSGKGWRKIGKFNYKLRGYEWDQAGMFANGALYWLDRQVQVIVTFDLAEEKFGESISPPPLPLPDGDWRYTGIGVLNGFLLFHAPPVDEGFGCFDVWIFKKKSVDSEMKDHEHELSVWSKEFRIDEEGILFAGTKSDGVFTMGFDYVSIYDTKTSTSKRLVEFNNCYLRQVAPHKNTFVSLKELGEEDTKKMGSQL